jgi:hypothetical protein
MCTLAPNTGLPPLLLLTLFRPLSSLPLLVLSPQRACMCVHT